MKKLFLGIAFLTIMCSCSGFTKQKEELKGRNYVLQLEEIKKENVKKETIKKEEKKKEDCKKEEKKVDKKKDNEITLSFKEENFYGSGGVNRYFGKYQAKKGKIEFKYFASTRAAGPKDLMERENTYFDTLNKVTEYKINKNTLILKASNGKVLKYNEVVNTENKKENKKEEKKK